MSRFAYTTLAAIVAFFAIGAALRGWTRIWAYTAMWSVYLTVVGLGVGFMRLNFFGPAICRGRIGRMKVALTFDDGPDPAATSALLDLLRRENIPAAFFCIGKRVAAHPEIAARIHADGHLLGNHTYHHAPLTAFMGAGGLTGEIALTQKAIFAATGAVPAYFRPPVGLTNPHFARVLRQAKLSMIGWDVRSLDTFGAAPNVIARVLRKTRDGSVILLHDGGSSPKRVVEIAGAIIEGLRARGFGFERLDVILNEPR
ncbi:MAG TPA: polysaccharide deacetylase family protein [Tepidisphaeraceae bacterium]|nr:polysaccharide deacetylase family protein [Tepidisphaeraceae bacterium]